MVGRVSDGVTKLARMDRLAFTEEVMARRFSRRGVERAIQEKYDVSARTARRYIRAVRKQWELEAEQDRPRVRSELRAKLTRIYEIAMERMEYVRGTDGEEGYYYKDRDLKVALLVVDRLAQLEGLDMEAEGGGYVVVVSPGTKSDTERDALKAEARKLKAGGTT